MQEKFYFYKQMQVKEQIHEPEEKVSHFLENLLRGSDQNKFLLKPS